MLIVARMLQHGLITNTPSNAHVRKRRPRGFIRVVREDRPISALSTLQSSLHRSLLISIVGSTGSLGMHQHGVMKMCFELVLVSEQEVASEGFLCETHLQLFLHIFVFFPGTKNPLTVSLIFLVTIFFILSLSLFLDSRQRTNESCFVIFYPGLLHSPSSQEDIQGPRSF